ncbi:BolA family transcriptional regulator [Pasteurella canis]|uniref:DNA-binding transcriptional regulator BolA n=1 Tax=Pasteurella canis TaxID=753 RepID=A0A379EX88_9PAST|nr:BolA family protein [Pasteurella canis]MXN89262.1 BolA/IbaG family iron-sulfur metabolism protein [Pasteurella canis]UAX42052.1 BolA family transcriptional regulator [Pasteurella canis]UAY77605.1 BolA family transcriptional regulator [Pasteurella canis]UDW83626.1 BolA family transcriptional regulator [Pasteurella canis]UEA16698.1 BolA family transcriptional regulator [Pasteurella canis]
MSKQQDLITRLSQEFAPHFLHIENESHMHSSGRGGDSHFKVVLVSDCFEGLTKVARHRKVYQFLAEDLQKGIHALALHLYNKAEWQALNETFPKSPNCLGVGQ